ncbi:MAG TPA: biotin/lipoyl-binding protein, partial [Pirellulales bacterium]
MLSDAETDATPLPGKDWQHIDEVLSELARLAESSSSSEGFYRELLARSMHVLAAIAGAVWLRGATGGLRMVCQSGFDRIALGDVQVSAGWHGEVLNAALQVRQGFCVPPSIAETAPGALANPTPQLLMVSPFALDDTVFGVFEVFQRSDCPPESVAGGLRFMAALAEVAGHFDRHQRLREAREREALWSQLQNFGLRVHRGLDLEAVADEIANEGRPIVGCDRLSVFVGDGGQARAVSVSGVDVIDGRAASVQLLQRLVQAVLVIGEPLWHPRPGESDSLLPTQLEERLEAYLDRAHARSIGIYPLASAASNDRDQPSPPLGALVAEAFTAESDLALWPQRLAAIARPSELALANAQRFESIPLVSLWRRLRPAGGNARRRRWMPMAVAAVGGLVLAAVLALVPVPFRIEARGELRPRRQAEIFAPNDGIVAEVDVEHASSVTAGQVLAVLRKPELDLEFSRIVGEAQTARKRLTAVQASRLGSSSSVDERTERGNQLTGEEEELKELIRSLEQQDRVLHLEREQLTVRSPLGGQVLTWDLKPLLEA